MARGPLSVAEPPPAGRPGLPWIALPAVLVLAMLSLAVDPAPVPAKGPSGDERGARARVAIAAAERLLQGRGARTGHELSPLLARVAGGLPALRGPERRAAVRLLARPTDKRAGDIGYGDAPLRRHCTVHFCVHWVTAGADAPEPVDADGVEDGDGVPDYVEAVLRESERARAVENGELGWRPPKGDGRRGGGLDKTDIYLKSLGTREGEGPLGYFARDVDQGLFARTVFGYIVLDDDLSREEYVAPDDHDGRPTSLDLLRITTAHEYNHALQAAYTADAPDWMSESTAVWIEDEVQDDVNDYVEGQLDLWTRFTWVPLTALRFDLAGAVDAKRYGSFVWNRWLAKRYGRDIVRDLWRRLARDDDDARVHNRAIAARGGRGFADEFARFAAVTAEWRSVQAGLEESESWPDIVRVGSLTVGGTPRRWKLDHSTFAVFHVRGPVNGRVRLAVLPPRRARSALALVGREGDHVTGRVSTDMLGPFRGNRQQVALDASERFSRLSAVLTNAEPSVGPDRDDQHYLVTASTDDVRPGIAVVYPGAGSVGVPRRSHIVIRFTEPVIGVTTRTFRLVDPDGDTVRARVHARGDRAVLVPARPLEAGGFYAVSVGPGIYDWGLNDLTFLGLGWTFTTRRR